MQSVEMIKWKTDVRMKKKRKTKQAKNQLFYLVKKVVRL